MATARDVMTADVVTIAETDTVEALIQLFRASHFTGIPVVDGDGRAVGVVAETDVLRAFAYTVSPPASGEVAVKNAGRERGATARLLRPDLAQREAGRIMKELVQRQVCEVMTPVVHACRPDDDLTTVCDIMVWKHIHRVVVLDDDRKVVGLISALDAVRSCSEVIRAGQSQGEGDA